MKEEMSEGGRKKGGHSEEVLESQGGLKSPGFSTRWGIDATLKADT